MKRNTRKSRRQGTDQSVWFIETKRFTTKWSELGLTSDDLIEMQDLIADDPSANPVIAGTGGLRKIRFASTSLGNKGKRSALRVCYAYLPAFSAIVLVLAYPKSEMDDIAPTFKKAIKDFLKRTEIEFEGKYEKT